MSYENGYVPEAQLQFVSDAVLSFGHALRDMHRDLCGGRPGLCPQMKAKDGATLLEFLKKTRFTGRESLSLLLLLLLLLCIQCMETSNYLCKYCSMHAKYRIVWR